MATINIGAGNADDAFYRYKMPKLVAKIEGRGNGIKTNVVNNVDIAKALERPPEYVLKYYGCELGAQTNYDKATGTSIVNGAHDAKKLSEILEGFIKKFVQCYSCGNPETTIKIKKDFLTLKCKACGFVSDVDPRHKLNTFILKNPPENKMSKEEKKLKKAEEERLREAGEQEKKEKKEKEDKENKEKKEKKDKGDKDKKEKKDKKDKKDKKKDEKGDDKPDEEEEAASEEEDDVVWMTDTSAEAAKRRAQEQLTAATAAMVTQGNIEAEEEAARKKAEREAKKKAEEEEARKKAEEEAKLAEEAARKLALEGPANGASNDPVQALRAAIEEGANPSDIATRVKGLSLSGGLAGKVRVLYEAVFADPSLPKTAKLVDLLKQRKPYFAALSRDAPGQLAQLIAMEHLVTVTMPDRIKEGALLLKALYDNDLALDEVILAWADKVDAGRIIEVPLDGARALRSHAAPLIDWLREEEESEEEEEEEEEDDD